MPRGPRNLKNPADTVRIFVLGDVNLDSLIVPLGPRSQAEPLGQMGWLREEHFWRHRRRGGAWLLAEIINAALRSPNFVKQFGTITAETYDPVACQGNRILIAGKTGEDLQQTLLIPTGAEALAA